MLGPKNVQTLGLLQFLLEATTIRQCRLYVTVCYKNSLPKVASSESWAGQNCANRTARHLFFVIVSLHLGVNIFPIPDSATQLIRDFWKNRWSSTSNVAPMHNPKIIYAISQASCRSPDDRRGVALPQDDVGGHVGVNHTQKVSRKCGNGNHSGQTPSGSGAPLRVFSRRRFCDAVWGRWRVLFFK